MRALFFALVACGGTNGTLGDASSDATQQNDGTTNDATMDTSMMDTSMMDGTNDVADSSIDNFDAGCGLQFVDGGACNSVAATGGPITPQCKNGNPPTAMGGAIPNGVYG